MDKARLNLFLDHGKLLDVLPMTSHTFVNVLKRAMYKACLWQQATSKTINMPEACEWGFKKVESNGTLEFDWGTETDVTAAKKWDTFRTCSCTTDCATNKRCGCHKEIPSSSTAPPKILGCITLCKCKCETLSQIGE